jgi:hypothetical protein
VGSDEKFLSHSGNYQLKHMAWPLDGQPPRTIIDRMPDYPSDDQEFAGLFGYQMTYTHCGFLDTSSKFFVITSETKGHERIFIVDLESGEIKQLHLDEHNNKKGGNYELMRKF